MKVERVYPNKFTTYKRHIIMKKEVSKTCGHCCSWSQWTGVCLNPKSERFDLATEEEVDYDEEGCDEFEYLDE